MLDDAIKVLTILVIIGMLCMTIRTIWTNVGWGKKIEREEINWNVEKIKDLEAQKHILSAKLYKRGTK